MPSKDTDRINKKIKDAFDKVTPDVLDTILSDIDSGEEIIVIPEPEKPKKFTFFYRLAASAAALAIVSGAALGLYSMHSGKTAAASVSLDVNPAVVIRVNAKDKVIDVTAKNSDAEKIIGVTDFGGSSLDLTVNTLVGSMLKHGYISEVSNSILVSVDGKDHEKSAALKKRLTHDIGKLLETDGFSGSVIGQTVEDSDLEEIAEKYGITEGKAQFVRRIISGGNSYTFDDLAKLSINELSLIADSHKTQVEDVEQVGSPSDKAYVGKENAVDAALDHAGINKTDVDTVNAEINLSDGAMVYEIDLNYSGCDYGFMINAIDGSIIKFSREITYDTEQQATETSAAEETASE